MGMMGVAVGVAVAVRMLIRRLAVRVGNRDYFRLAAWAHHVGPRNPGRGPSNESREAPRWVHRDFRWAFR